MLSLIGVSCLTAIELGGITALANEGGDMTRHYQKSPIQEAVCELRLSSQYQWGPESPERICHELTSLFPIREDGVVQGFRANPSPMPNEPQLIVSASLEIRLKTPDKQTLVKVGDRLVALSQLQSYDGWVAFEAHLERLLAAVGSVDHLSDCQRVGLRYVNRINIPTLDNVALLEKYFRFRLTSIPGLQAPPETYIAGFVVPCREGMDRCRVQLSSAVSEVPEMSSALLDIDYSTTPSGSAGEDTVIEWAQQAHSSVEDVFEACITNETRDLLGGETV
jgi:uncharacterized protein (TIGR04255 family)